MFIQAVLFLSLLTLSALAGDSKDIHGWDKAKWGMTEKQVVEAFGKRAEHHQRDKYAKWYSTICVKGVAFGKKEYLADMLFDNNSGRLSGINLRAQDEKSLDVVAEFKRLSILLNKQYGEPNEQSPTKMIWIFPSTTVRLEYEPTFLRVGINIFGVYFRPN